MGSAFCWPSGPHTSLSHDHPPLPSPVLGMLVRRRVRWQGKTRRWRKSVSPAGQRLASSFPGLGRDEMRTQDSGSQAHLSGSALSCAPSCPLTRGQKPWRGLNEQAWGGLKACTARGSGSLGRAHEDPEYRARAAKGSLESFTEIRGSRLATTPVPQEDDITVGGSLPRLENSHFQVRLGSPGMAAWCLVTSRCFLAHWAIRPEILQCLVQGQTGRRRKG